MRFGAALHAQLHVTALKFELGDVFFDEEFYEFFDFFLVHSSVRKYVLADREFRGTGSAHSMGLLLDSRQRRRLLRRTGIAINRASALTRNSNNNADASEFQQFFRGRRQDLVSALGDRNHVFNSYTALTGQINAGLNRNYHARLQHFGLLPRNARLFVNL
jgi:hypothetical protein